MPGTHVPDPDYYPADWKCYEACTIWGISWERNIMQFEVQHWVKEAIHIGELCVPYEQISSR